MDQAIRDMLLARGAAMVGYADLRRLPGAAAGGFPTGVAIALALDRRVMRGILNGPTAEYFEEYKRANSFLDELSAEAVALIQEKGFRAVAQKSTMGPDLDRATLTAPLPHKTVATLAGLGWIGKTALLITEPFGSAVRLTSVLTDAPLKTAEPVERSRCGQCDCCVTACPAGASRNELWSAGMARAEMYDAFACFSKARELSSRVGVKETICGICIRVCPWTKRYLDS
jgi:epoxyqueuosine reductase QueG